MSVGAHTIQSPTGARKQTKRVGRGNASQKGTYSSRGMKGQRARSGGKKGTKRRGLKPSLQKIPKIRGFKSDFPRPQTVTLQMLERACADGENVNPVALRSKGLVRDLKKGIKIVATGELKKKIIVTDCLATKKAIQMIEQTGGKINF